MADRVDLDRLERRIARAAAGEALWPTISVNEAEYLYHVARAAQKVMAEGSSVDEHAIRHEGTGSCRFCHAPWEQPTPYPHPHQPTCVWGTLRAALAGRDG